MLIFLYSKCKVFLNLRKYFIIFAKISPNWLGISWKFSEKPRCYFREISHILKRKTSVKKLKHFPTLLYSPIPHSLTSIRTTLFYVNYWSDMISHREKNGFETCPPTHTHFHESISDLGTVLNLFVSFRYRSFIIEGLLWSLTYLSGPTAWKCPPRPKGRIFSGSNIKIKKNMFMYGTC